MGEETDIVEPISSEDIGAAKDLTANEPSKDHRRKRKKHLYKSLKELLEFYLGDVNIAKDRFINQSIQGQPFVYMDLATFLMFNKVKALTSNIEDLQKAIINSEILQLSEDKTQVCRKTPITRKENEEECTIYIEQLGPDVEHDALIKMFSEYGPVDYISLPRFSHNGKCKGFGFVEFKDPQFAKKALEAFNAKGCCLSPQMAPEDLLSIKNYDPKMECKKKDAVKKGIPINMAEVNENNKGLKNDHNIDENEGSVAESTNAIVSSKKEKKKRKFSDDIDEVVNKKLKRNNALVNEGYDNRENQTNNEGESLVSESNLASLNDKTKLKNKSDKSIHSSNSNKPQQKTEACEKNEGGKKRKAKHSEEGIGDISLEGNDTLDNEENSKQVKRKNSTEETTDMADKNPESSEPTTKKLKSETEGTDESNTDKEAENDDGSNKQKKKRKRKKKLKKDSSAISMGLKILSKKEWKQLRNKYLNMQKKTMRSLKQHLSYSKWEKNKPEEKSMKVEDIKSGTVIKVTLEKPVIDCITAKSEMRVHPEVRYVDVTEGECIVYLRTSTPEVATTLLQTNHWPNMEVLKGDEETEYWEKIKKDREIHFNKNKHNQRGRTKLLKRAERYL